MPFLLVPRWRQPSPSWKKPVALAGANTYADSEKLYAVEAAVAVEALLGAHEARIIDPPVASIYCVCPAYYPDL